MVNISFFPAPPFMFEGQLWDIIRRASPHYYGWGLFEGYEYYISEYVEIAAHYTYEDTDIDGAFYAGAGYHRFVTGAIEAVIARLDAVPKTGTPVDIDGDGAIVQIPSNATKEGTLVRIFNRPLLQAVSKAFNGAVFDGGGYLSINNDAARVNFIPHVIRI